MRFTARLSEASKSLHSLIQGYALNVEIPEQKSRKAKFPSSLNRVRLKTIPLLF